jgi:predicted HAD superfamily Cof-like phosphohydrolase
MQRTLIVEEFKEFLDAENQLLTGFVVNATDTLKELADLVYVCYQYAENLGWDLDEALNRVHRSNMSKLGEDGEPVYREDGKVLKGPNYEPPNLSDLV